MLSSTKLGVREGEIVEVVFRRGWDYMRRLLIGGETDEPELPTPAVLRNILLDLGPVYIKLGQLLSTRPDLLPSTYIEALSSLQAQVPPVGWAEISVTIREELPRPLEELFTQVDPDAIASGSIGQIHKATLKDGKPVALKVQRPGIQTIVAQDIGIIKNLAQLVSLTNFGQKFDIVALAEEFTNALNAELDFTQEASHTDRLKRNLAQSRWFDANELTVPEIFWDLTTPRLLVMEWMEGKPLLSAQFPDTSAHNGDRSKRHQLASLIFRAFLQQYLLDGFFHADPHPGNLFYLDDGRIALIDCGMVGQMNSRTRALLTEIVLAIINSDAQRCSQLSLQLAEPLQPIDLVRLEKDYERLMRRYSSLRLSELNTSELFQELLQTGVNNNLRWPSNIGLFAKSLTNLEGTARQLYPDLNAEQEIEPLAADLFQHQLMGERPLETFLRVALEFKNLSLASPRQFGFLLDRLSSETLKFNLTIQGVDSMRRSIEDAANRRSFSTVVAALIIGAAIVYSKEQTAQFQLISEILFAAASLLGLWLIFSIFRSGKLK